jgi:hypothetical protein
VSRLTFDEDLDGRIARRSVARVIGNDCRDVLHGTQTQETKEEKNNKRISRTNCFQMKSHWLHVYERSPVKSHFPSVGMINEIKIRPFDIFFPFSPSRIVVNQEDTLTERESS